MDSSSSAKVDVALLVSILAIFVALVPLLAYFARAYLPKVLFRVGGEHQGDSIGVPKNGSVPFAVLTRSKRRVLLTGVWVAFDPDEVDLSKTKGAEQRITTDREFPVALFFPELRVVSRGHLQANYLDYHARNEAFRLKFTAYATLDAAELPWFLDMFGPKAFRAERMLHFSVATNAHDLREYGLSVSPGESFSVEGPQAQQAVWAKTDKAGTTLRMIELVENGKMYDPNMETALRWANSLSSDSVLPASLTDRGRRAELVKVIDDPLPRGPLLLHQLPQEEAQRRLQEVALLSKEFVPDVPDDGKRVSIVLRLWSGCLMAAKTIAEETRSGPNTPEIRRTTFEQVIDPQAESDAVFRAGVEAAAAFKRLRKQAYSFEGVPGGSSVVEDASRPD